jgi:hypothetical protein
VNTIVVVVVVVVVAMHVCLSPNHFRAITSELSRLALK